MRLPKFLMPAAAFACAGITVPAEAGPSTTALADCLVRSSSASDRGVLIRWTFVALALHPAVRDLTSNVEARQQEITRTAGRLFTRLIVSDCRRETVTAVRADGSEAIGAAFRRLGEAASTELLGSPAGAAVLADVANHMDLQALEALLEEAAASARPVT